METLTPQEIKYPIEKEFKEKLKLYFMCARSMPMVIPIQEMFIGVIAYRHEDAIGKAIETYKPLEIISHGNYETIENIFRGISTAEIKIVAQPIQPMPQPAILPIESFKAGLLMATDQYIKDENDKETVKQIIQKIQ